MSKENDSIRISKQSKSITRTGWTKKRWLMAAEISYAALNNIPTQETIKKENLFFDIVLMSRI